MLILTIRTDKPLAKIAIYEGLQKKDELNWEANRILADTINQNLLKLLESSNLAWEQIDGLVCFKGSGSFTGLRIGLSVANALAYSLGIPIVSSAGDDWQETGVKRLLSKEDEKIALPDYGGEVFTTPPKK